MNDNDIQHVKNVMENRDVYWQDHMQQMHKVDYFTNGYKDSDTIFMFCESGCTPPTELVKMKDFYSIEPLFQESAKNQAGDLDISADDGIMGQRPCERRRPLFERLKRSLNEGIDFFKRGLYEN